MIMKSFFMISAAQQCQASSSQLQAGVVGNTLFRPRKMIICQSLARDSASFQQQNNSRGTITISTPRAAPEEEDEDEESMGLTDTPLSSTLEHRLWTIAGCCSIAGMLVKSVLAAGNSPEQLEFAALSSVSAYIVADLATGIYHWAVDNYGDASTPVFGSQIDGFQGHHKRPWTITRREFCNNIHALARPAAVFLLPIILFAPGDASLDAFLGMFLGFVVFSQQFHAWAHMKRSELPRAVIALQELGFLVSPRAHGQHHRAPFSCNYCIVSGIWNGALDESKALRQLEKFIFWNWGYAPRCWDSEDYM